jgi:hypothetical protein
MAQTPVLPIEIKIKNKKKTEPRSPVDSWSHFGF